MVRVGYFVLGLLSAWMVWGAGPVSASSVFRDQALGPIRATPPGHDLRYVLAGMERTARNTASFRADLQVAEAVPVRRGSRQRRWRVETGTAELARSRGARIMLRRDANRFREYTANPRILIEYDGRKNQVNTVPATLPIVSGLVRRGLEFDPSLITESGSLRLIGLQTVGGVSTYRLEGQTPTRYATFGLRRQPVRIWLREADFAPVRMELPQMNQTVVNFTNVQLNQPINPGRFEFRTPTGATVRRVLGF